MKGIADSSFNTGILPRIGIGDNVSIKMSSNSHGINWT